MDRFERVSTNNRLPLSPVLFHTILEGPRRRVLDLVRENRDLFLVQKTLVHTLFRTTPLIILTCLG